MAKVKDYLLLHICVLIFSFTSVFAKFAANAYNEGGFMNIRLFLYVFLMLSVCVVYAFFWQKVIKNVDLHVGYANRSVYLIWGQLWAVLIFNEQLNTKNIIGLLVVLTGVLIVSLNTNYEDDSKEVLSAATAGATADTALTDATADTSLTDATSAGETLANATAGEAHDEGKEGRL